MKGSIDTRAPFFPTTKGSTTIAPKKQEDIGGVDKKANIDRIEDIKNRTGKDAKVDIPDAVKDFSRIKKAVDAAPDIDNSAKIARLKDQIKNGTYQVDYDAVAERMLNTEF